MEFVPPRCPNPECSNHQAPEPGFYERHGYYHAACRDRAQVRYRCCKCRRTFSRQTFRHDYRDRRPETNEGLFAYLTSGVGLRQAGRYLGLSIGSVLRKKSKIARTSELLHGRLCQTLPAGRTFLIDEEESYEGASIRPVTMPVVIELETWFVVGSAVGSIRRLAPEGTRRREKQDADEAKHGTRADQSAERVRDVLTQLRKLVGDAPLTLRSDQKSSYATIAREVFGDRLVHETTSGKAPRTTSNPLFAINTTMAMTRDNCGRLRRRTWLVSKKAAMLAEHLHIFTVYRNYVRRRFNRDKPDWPSARFLGLLERSLEVSEVLGWRQDWGERSVSPTCGEGGAADVAVAS